MKNLFVVCGIIFILLIGGCSNQTDTSDTTKPITKDTKALVEEKSVQKDAEPSIIQRSQATTKTTSELALVLSDLPEGYTIKERTPRLKSDVSKEAIDLGWEDGYYIRFARIGEDIFDATVIEQFISIYPINDVKKVLDLPEQSNENVTYEELPSSDLGVESKAYRITYIDEFGTQERVYQIEFFKKNVYQEIDMSGTATDYELLKEIVKKSIKKI